MSSHSGNQYPSHRICGIDGDILFAVVKLSLWKYDLVNQAAVNMGDKLSQEQDFCNISEDRALYHVNRLSGACRQGGVGGMGQGSWPRSV